MSDRVRVLEALRLAGPQGVHSLDLRRYGLTGNPSQRVAELRELGCVIEGIPERRGGRNGRRYVLHHEPETAGEGSGPSDGDPVGPPRVASLPGGPGTQPAAPASPHPGHARKPPEASPPVPGGAPVPANAPGTLFNRNDFHRPRDPLRDGDEEVVR